MKFNQNNFSRQRSWSIEFFQKSVFPRSIFSEACENVLGKLQKVKLNICSREPTPSAKSETITILRSMSFADINIDWKSPQRIHEMA